MFLMTILVCTSITCTEKDAIDVIRPKWEYSSFIECTRAGMMQIAAIRDLIPQDDEHKDAFPVISCRKAADT